MQYAPVSRAATDTWTAGSGLNLNWADPTNWSGGTPDATSDVVLPGVVPNPGSLPTPSQLTLGAGSLANGILFSNSYTLGGGDLTLTTGQVSVDPTFTGTINTALIGTGGLSKLGTGTLVLGGTNLYSGLTTVSAGTLRFSSSGNLGDNSATNSISLAGGTLSNTGTTVDLGVNRTVAVSGTGSTISSATGTDLTVSGALAGTADLGIGGGGRVILSADNSGYTGNITVSAGATTNSTLRLANSNAFVAGNLTLNQGGFAGGVGNSVDLANTVTIGSTATLVMNSNATGDFRSSLTTQTGANAVWNGGISLKGSGLNQINSAGILTINGNIVDGGGFTGTLFLRGTGNGTVSGSINTPNAALSKTDTGTWLISSPSVIVNSLRVADGTMQIGLTNTFSTSQVLTLGQSSGTSGNFDLNGFDQTFANIVVDPASTGTNNRISNSSLTLSTLTVNNASASTYTGSLQGNLKVVVNGAAALTLAGNGSTQSGGIVVNAGKTLNVNATGASTTATGTGVTTSVVNNATGAGAISLATGSVLNLNALATTSTNGLSGRVFNGAPTNNDTTNVNFTGTATSTRYDANLFRYDLTTTPGGPGTGNTALSPTTNVAVQWLGKLNVTNAGAYRFFTASDDGSRVFIDGVLAVNNDGSKGVTDLGSAAITLTPGLHDIAVQYTQGGGGAGEILAWAGMAGGLDAPLTRTVIPSTSLYTAESNTTAAGSNAVVIGSGSGTGLTITGDSTVNVGGTATQTQMGGLTQSVGTTLTVTGTAGKTLRLAGASSLGNGAAGTITINSTPNVALGGTLTDGGNAVTLVKQGSGRLIFDQNAVANTLGATTTIDVQGGSIVLVGGANNPIGTATVQLNGGNMVLDSVSGARTFDNNMIVAQNASIQSIVAGVGPIVTTLGSATRGITINSGATLTLDAITGANNLVNNASGSTEAGAQITVAGVITGPGNLNAISTSYGNTVTPGVVQLNAVNTFAGSITLNGTTFTGNTAIPVNGPTLIVGAAGALPSGAGNALFIKSGTLNLSTNNIAYTPNAANVLTMGGGPATTTSNIQIGTGNLVLSNDVVYDATNNGGVATIRGNAALTGIVDLGGVNRTFNVGNSSNAPIDLIVNAVINNGGIIKTGAGTMALQANVTAANTQVNNYTGLTQVSQGTLFVGGGTGFAGDAAIKGDIQIDAGATFKLAQGNIIINTSIITANGTMDMNGLQESFGNIAGNGLLTAAVPGGFAFLDMPNNAPTFTGTLGGQAQVWFGGRLMTANVTIPTSQFAAITNNGGIIVGSAAGTGNGNGDSTFAITLQLSSNNALPSGFNRGDVQLIGTATLNKGGILDLNGFNQTVNGLIGATNTQNPIVTNSGTSDSTLTVGAGNGGNTFAGIIQDGGTNKINIVKVGLGTQALSGPNTYTGLTTINNGQLTIGNATALGTTAAGTVVNSGGILSISNVSSAEPITISGRGQPVAVTAGSPGATYSGALQGTGFTVANSLTGTVTLAANSAIGVPAGSLLTIAGVISDGGSGFALTKTQGNGTIIATNATSGGGGILKLTGNNTYTGATTVEGGSLWLGAVSGQAIQSTLVRIGNNRDGAELTLLGNEQMVSGVTLDFGQGQGVAAKFQLNGFTQTVAGFSNSAGSTPFIQNHENGAAATPGTLIVNNASNTSYFGGIRDLNGVLQVTKQGAGTLTFSGNGASGTGAATYTGATNVTAGKLLLNDETAFASPITLSGSGSLEFNYNYGRTLVYAKAITDNGIGFTKTGLGNLTINTLGNVTGPINVNQGILNLTDATGNVNPLPGAPINVAAGAQLQFYGVTAVTTVFNNNVTLNGMTPGGAFSGAVVGGTPTNTLSGTLTLAATSNISTGWSDKTLQITGQITGPGGLVIDKLHFTQQPGIIKISNTANDYAGGTTLNTGTVFFADNTLPSTGNLKFGGTFGNGGNFGVGQLVLGTGGLTGPFTRALGTSAGQVQFTGDGGGFSAIGSAQTVTFGGGGTINWSGTGLGLDANASFVNNTGTGANNNITVTNDINLNSGVRRIVSGASNVFYTGIISGTSELIIDGAGTTNFTGLDTTANTYTGLTNVSGGTLILGKTNLTTPGVAIAGDLQISSNLGGTRRVVYLNANEQIADTATVTFLGQNANNGDLRLLGFNETVAAIQDRSGGGVIEAVEAETATTSLAANGQSATTSTLIINGPGDSFYNGFIRNRGSGTYTGVLALTKNGSGTLTISAGQQSGTGNQIYSGATTINGGTLKFNNTEALATAITVNAGNVEFSEGITRSYTPGAAVVISGAGNFVKSGLGNLSLANANNYSGTTSVNAGTLTITGTQGVLQTGAYSVASGATLVIGNGTTAGVLTNNNNINVSANGLVQFSRNNAYAYTGVISGAGNVLVNTAGAAITAGGANTYTGTTTVNAGALTVAGSAISAGGLTLGTGGTLTLDFANANSAATNLVAGTAPINFNGGTLTFSATGGTSQSFGTVNVNAGTSTLNPNGNAIAFNLGNFTHQVGGTLNLSSAPTGTTISPSAGGILNGYTVFGGGTTWVSNTAGTLGSLTVASSIDTWSGNTDVTTNSTQAASAIANSLRFTSAATVTLDGASTSTITTGGILVTSTVAAPSGITGGTLRGSTSGDFVVHNYSTSNFTISSNIVDNGATPTGFTKTGTGNVTLSGTNTYTGGTVVNQGTLISTGSLGTGPARAINGAVLQIGDGTTTGVLPTFGVNNNTVIIATGSTPQTLNTIFNAAPNFPFVVNGIGNATSNQTGSFQKNGAGTLTLVAPLLTNTFHPQNGTTIIDNGANVLASNFTSVGRLNGDVGTLTMQGIGRAVIGSGGSGGDFNVSDLPGSRGTVNVTDGAILNVRTLYVGKGSAGTSVGVLNLSGAGTIAVGGGLTNGGDWRVGGGTANTDVNASGNVNLSGAATLTYGGNFQIGAYGQGVLNQTGGTFTNSGTPVIARWQNGANGVLNVSGGLFNQTTAANRFIVGETGTGLVNVGSSNSAVTPYSAGQLFLTGGLSMGAATSGTGVGSVNLSYGGLINATTVGDHNAVNTTTPSYLNFHGGILQARATSVLSSAGGNLTLLGGGSATNFNGALTAATVWSEGAFIDTNGFNSTVAQQLVTPSGNGVNAAIVTSGGSGYTGEAIVTFTGGTLAPNGSPATGRAIVNLNTGLVTSIVLTNPGSYTVDPTGITISGGGGTGATAVLATAANTTNGGLTKLGAGTMTFTSNTGTLSTTVGAASTYGGNTTVNGGTLLLDFNQWNVTPTNMVPATSNLILGGGILSVNGQLGVVTAPTGVTGTWTSGQNIITLSSGTNVAVGETITGTGIPAGAIVTSVNGAGITISAATTAAGAAAALTFGTRTSTAASQTFASTTLNQGANAINALVNGGAGTSIVLNGITRNVGSTVDFALPATGSITTSAINTGTSILGGWATVNNGANWAVTGASGTNPVTALGTYTDNTWAAGTNTNMTTAGTVTSLTTNSVRFNTATPVTVTVSGTDVITTGGILVTPTATAAATLFTGGTLNSGGGDLIVNHFGSAAATIASVIGAGTGGLVKSGGGALVISGTNLYTGTTTVGAGTLRLGVATAIPDTSVVTVSAGATLDLNNFSETIGGLQGYGTIIQAVTPGTDNTTNTATLTISSSSNTTFSGLFNDTVSGTGTNRRGAVAVTKTGAGTLTLNNVAAGTYTGATNINAGAIKIATPNAMANNTTINVNTANGLLFDVTNPVISGLGGNSSFSLQTTATSAVPNAPVFLTVGNNNATATSTGFVSGPGALIKIGTGNQTISGNNTNTGGFGVAAGTLALGGNNSGASGSVFVNGGVMQFNASNSFVGATGRNIGVASGAAVSGQAATGNPTIPGISTLTSILNRVDVNSVGIFALQSDASVQTPITENLDFSSSAPLTVGALISGNTGFGNAPVRYTGVITPNANTFRLGGGGGRLILPNSATLSGANGLITFGGGSSAGSLFLTAAYGYTGSNLLNPGTTTVTNLANGGLASSLGASTSDASNLVINGATLQYVGAGSTTDRLFTMGAATIEASGTGPVVFSNPGSIAFLNVANRTLTLQGNNTSTNTLAASLGDQINAANANGTTGSSITSLAKSGNGTWVVSGNNTFTGGVTINNGVLVFANASSFGGSTINGPGSVLVGANGAAALGSGLAGSLQASLNRISPLSSGTVALTANSSENLNFDGGSTGSSLSQAFLGAYGNVTYTGTLTPFGNTYRLGGGGGTLTLPNGGLTGPRGLTIGGGGPGTSFVNNPNLNGAVVLGGTSDFSGGTTLATGAILSATTLTALGSGPLKFQGGVYRAIDTTDITVASDGVTPREIRIGADTSGSAVTANVDVINGVNTTFSNMFGIPPALGSNQGQMSFTKFGGGSLVLAGGITLSTTDGTNSVRSNAGTITIERGTLSLGSNPTNYVGNIQVGSNNGGVGTLKLVANNVFAGSAAQYAAGNVVDLYNGSKLDLNGFSDTIRNIRGMGSVVNTGGGSPTLTTGTVQSENMIWGGNLVGNFTLRRVGNIAVQYGTGNNANGIELWNNFNPNFTGKFVAEGGGIRFRSDGTLGSPTEPLVADKITLNSGTIFNTGGTPVVLGANRGITLAGPGMLWAFGSNPFIIGGPISGANMLTISDDAGFVALSSDNNTYTGGTTINSNAAGRGILTIGAGGATGALPAGDVYFNSAAGTARLMFFKSTDMTFANTIYGPGQVFQIGSGTTTLTGANNTGQATIVQGGKLRVDFTDPTKAPIGVGTGLTVAAGTFEYLAPAGNNTLRLGTLTVTNVGNNGLYASAMTGGGIGDSIIQSTYGGSGTTNLIFGGLTRGTVGVTTNFVTSGGVNGDTNNIRFSAGATASAVIGAAFYFNGSEFAAYDVNQFVRAPVYGSDSNTAPLNTLFTSRYSKLTTSLINQLPVQPAGIHLAGPNVNLNFADSGNTTTPFTLNGNPAAILKTGGGGAAGVSIISGGVMPLSISAGTTTPETLNNNAQELILRPVAADDFLQIDMPIAGTGALTKSGLGQVTLTANNIYTGNTLISQGTVLLTGNGTIGTAASAAGELRIGNAAGQSGALVIDSPNAGITLATGANAMRVGEAGTGLVNQSAGTVNVSNYLTVGESLGASGTYNISGGTLNVKTNNGTPAAGTAGQNNAVVGRVGVGTLNVSANANVNILNGAQLMLGMGTNNSGQFQGMVPNAALNTGVGTINQTGGNVNVAVNNGTYQSNIYGGVIIGVDGTGTYNLNGGTLTTPAIGRGHGTATFNLGSGTLKVAAPVATLSLPFFNPDIPVNVTATGVNKGIIDTNGSDVTMTSNITGVGGFAKNGGGALTLISNGSNYSGGTDINAGTVVASGSSLGSGTVNVGASGTLSLMGVQEGLLARFINATTTAAVNPGVTTGNTASMVTELSSLENFNAFLAGKNAVAVESTAARGKTTVDYLETAGTNGQSALPPALIQTNGGGNAFVAALAGKFNAPTSGDYTFQTRSDDASALWIDGAPVLDNNRSQGQTNRTGTINLSAGPHDIVIGYQQGSGGGGFSVGVTLPNQGQSYTLGNELNMSNSLLSYGSSSLTIGSLAGSGATQLGGNTLLTGSDNTSTTYSGTISGTGGNLIKQGTGIMTLTNTHTYSGATTVSSGTLQVGTPSTAGSIAASSGVTVASSASFVAGSNTTVKSLNLSASNANATILAGALRILTVGDGTSDTGLLDISGSGSKLDLNSGAMVLNFNSAGVGTSLRDTIKNLIGTGKIMSSRAIAANLADPNTPVGIGYALGDYTSVGLPSDSTSIVTRYTLVGDANLDGVVDVGDLGTALAPNYGSPSGNFWQSGDFNGDGAVDTSDLALLAANYGKTLTLPGEPVGNLNLNFEQDLAQAFASVPEPGTLSVLGLAALALLKRRNRRTSNAA